MPTKARPMRHRQSNSRAAARGYLCLAAHNIPDDSLLEQVAPEAIGEYMAIWRSRTRHVRANAPASVIVSGGNLSLEPLPVNIVDDAPYQLCYAHAFDERTQNAECRVRGFVIYTSPLASIARAKRFIDSGMTVEGLLHYDKGIAGFAELRPEAITPSVERRYNRYARLRNLAVGAADNNSNEVLLALRLALREAERCWSELQAAINDCDDWGYHG